MDLSETVGALAALFLIFGFCLWQERRHRDMGDVKMLPYIPIMIVCMVMLLALGAHAVGLITGIKVGR